MRDYNNSSDILQSSEPLYLLIYSNTLPRKFNCSSQRGGHNLFREALETRLALMQASDGIDDIRDIDIQLRDFRL